MTDPLTTDPGSSTIDPAESDAMVALRAELAASQRERDRANEERDAAAAALRASQAPQAVSTAPQLDFTELAPALAQADALGGTVEHRGVVFHVTDGDRDPAWDAAISLAVALNPAPIDTLGSDSDR